MKSFWHLTGTNFVSPYESSESGLQLQLKIYLDRWSVLGHSTTGLVRPGLPNCMWLLLCQAIRQPLSPVKGSMMWGDSTNQVLNVPLSYIKTIAREFFHLWGVRTGGEQVPEPTLWAPRFLHLPGTCLEPNYNFSNGSILTLWWHQNIFGTSLALVWHQNTSSHMAPPWYLFGTKLWFKS